MQYQSITAKGGTAVISDGKISYTPGCRILRTGHIHLLAVQIWLQSSRTATVAVVVNCPTCPVAVNDQATRLKGRAATIDVLANDKDTTGATICEVQSTTAKRKGCHQQR